MFRCSEQWVPWVPCENQQSERAKKAQRPGAVGYMLHHLSEHFIINCQNLNLVKHRSHVCLVEVRAAVAVPLLLLHHLLVVSEAHRGLVQVELPISSLPRPGHSLQRSDMSRVPLCSVQLG